MDAPDCRRAGSRLTAPMDYANLIAKEVAILSAEKQVEVLDFIRILKMKQSCTEELYVPRTLHEIEAFFRSFKVDIRNVKFDRDDANAR
jgi:hypothetical protein